MAKIFSSASSILEKLKPIDFSSDDDNDDGDYDEDVEGYLASAQDGAIELAVDNLVKISQQTKERSKQSRADKKAAATRLRREQTAAAGGVAGASATPHKWAELASTNGAAFYEREHPMEVMRLNIFPIVPKGEKAVLARVVVMPKSIESVAQLLDAVHNIYPTQLASGAVAGELQYNGRAVSDVRTLFHEQDLQLMYSATTSADSSSSASADNDGDDDGDDGGGGVKNLRKQHNSNNNDDDDDGDAAAPDLPKKTTTTTTSSKAAAAATSSASSTPSKQAPSELDKSMDAELDLLLGVSGHRPARHIGKSRGLYNLLLFYLFLILFYLFICMFSDLAARSREMLEHSFHELEQFNNKPAAAGPPLGVAIVGVQLDEVRALMDAYAPPLLT